MAGLCGVDWRRRLRHHFLSGPEEAEKTFSNAHIFFLLLSITWLVWTLTCWSFWLCYIPETTWSRFCPVDCQNSRNISWSPAGRSSGPEQTDTLSHPSAFRVEGAFDQRWPAPGPVLKWDEILQDAVEEAEGTHTHQFTFAKTLFPDSRFWTYHQDIHVRAC